MPIGFLYPNSLSVMLRIFFILYTLSFSQNLILASEADDPELRLAQITQEEKKIRGIYQQEADHCWRYVMVTQCQNLATEKLVARLNQINQMKLDAHALAYAQRMRDHAQKNREANTHLFIDSN